MKWILNRTCLSSNRGQDTEKCKLLILLVQFFFMNWEIHHANSTVKSIQVMPGKPRWASFTITACSYCWRRALLKSLPFLPWLIVIQRDQRGVNKLISEDSSPKLSQCLSWFGMRNSWRRRALRTAAKGKSKTARKTTVSGDGKEHLWGCWSKLESPDIQSLGLFTNTTCPHTTQSISRLV